MEYYVAVEKHEVDFSGLIWKVWNGLLMKYRIAKKSNVVLFVYVLWMHRKFIKEYMSDC